MLSPSWLLICLLEPPDGIYAVFWLGLVTGASEINWEGLCTISKKEKKKPINEPKNTQTKCEKSLIKVFVTTEKMPKHSHLRVCFLTLSVLRLINSSS